MQQIVNYSINFTLNLKSDILDLIATASSDTLGERVASIALRVIGGICYVSTGISVLSAAVSIVVNPPSALFSLFASALSLLIGHDLVVIGENVQINSIGLEQEQKVRKEVDEAAKKRQEEIEKAQEEQKKQGLLRRVTSAVFGSQLALDEMYAPIPEISPFEPVSLLSRTWIVADLTIAILRRYTTSI